MFVCIVPDHPNSCHLACICNIFHPTQFCKTPVQTCSAGVHSCWAWTRQAVWLALRLADTFEHEKFESRTFTVSLMAMSRSRSVNLHWPGQMTFPSTFYWQKQGNNISKVNSEVWHISDSWSVPYNNQLFMHGHGSEAGENCTWEEKRLNPASLNFSLIGQLLWVPQNSNKDMGHVTWHPHLIFLLPERF